MISYYDYYLEIKNRSVLVLICWAFVSIVCYLYKEIILFLLIEINQNSLTNLKKSYFIFTNINEIFRVYVQLTFFISNQVTFFFLMYHSVLFLSSGLYRSEYKRLQLIFKMILLSGVVSFFLLNKLVLPVSSNFFLSFQQTNSGEFFFESRIADYYDYFVGLYQICFLSCQLLSAALLILINLSNNMLEIKKFRKLFYLLFLVFATLVTPPDIVSQIFLSTSLTIFCEFILFLMIIKVNKVAN